MSDYNSRESVDAKRNGSVSHSHLEQYPISDSSREYLSTIDYSIDTIVEMDRLIRTYPHQFRDVLTWASSETRHSLLLTLARFRLGVGYARLAEKTGYTRDSVRMKVKELIDIGICEREGKPAQIRYVDSDRRILTIQALSYISP